MKLLSTLFILVVLTACGKKAEFDGRNAGPNTPVGSDPVTLDAQYKNTQSMTADIDYSNKVRTGGNESNLPVRNEGFKLPQDMTVTKGWASPSTTAKFTLVVDGGASVICTYTSTAHSNTPHYNANWTTEQKSAGQKYTFSNCTDTNIDPTVVVDGFDRIVLSVNSADDLQTETVVETDVKLYE